VFGTVRKMKALVLKRYGTPDQITFDDIPKPALKPDEFLVQVQESPCLARVVEKASGQVRQDLDDFDLATLGPPEVFRRILQKFSPAGVTSPFIARVIPTDITSVVPVIGR
jgi:hypothetical protein